MYYFIVNPSSKTGKGKALWHNIKLVLEKNNVQFKSFFTKGSGDAASFAKQICEMDDDDKHLIIVGGDGTANEAVNGIVTSDSLTVGYIPTGSGNDLARGLGVPSDPMKALQIILDSDKHQAKITSFDRGQLTVMDDDKNSHNVNMPSYPDADNAGKRYFSVSSGIGYDADICYEVLTSKLKKVLNKLHIGKLVYFIIGIKQVIVNKPAKAHIVLDGGKVIDTKKLIFIANMNHRCEGGGLPMGPDANPTDGKLTSCIVHDMCKLKILMLMPTIFFAKQGKFKGVDLIDCHTLEVQTDRPLVIHTDGEFAGKHDHIRFECSDMMKFICN